MSNDTPKVQNNDEVICPNCVHQFRAIPVNVQGDLAALRERLDEAERENTALRAMQVGVKCAYGYKNADGVCALGYPGCACMDDLCATMEWGPDDLHAQANRRLLERATQAERERDECKRDAAQNKMGLGFALDRLVINSENIGDIRGALLMQIPCQWNAWVRDMTAERCNKPPIHPADLQKNIDAAREGK
jgi:hypothetical protein